MIKDLLKFIVALLLLMLWISISATYYPVINAVIKNISLPDFLILFFKIVISLFAGASVIALFILVLYRVYLLFERN